MYQRPTRRDFLPERKEQLLTPETLDLAGHAIEHDYVVRYEKYPSDHVVTQYAQSCLDSVLADDDIGKYTVVVTRGWTSENAAALPNGTILFSDRLLTTTDGDPRTVEEIQFVLRHEMFHIKKEHSKQNDQITQSRKKSISTGQLYKAKSARIGADRIHEYEADIRANTGLDEDSHNPYGGIRFMERATEKAQRKKINSRGPLFEDIERSTGNITHGSAINRLLNLHYSARLIDSASMSTSLTPIPKDITDALEHAVPRISVLEKNIWQEREIGRAEFNRDKALREATSDEILQFVAPAYTKWKKIDSKKWSRSTESARLKTETEELFTQRILTRAHKEITEKVRPLSKPIDRSFYRGVAAELAYGLPLEDANDPKSMMSAFVDFYEYFEDGEDFLAVPELLRGMENSDLILRQSPESLLLYFASEACDFEAFDTNDGSIDMNAFFAYCEDLLDATFSLYEKNGIIDLPEKSTLFNKMIAFGYLSVPQEQVKERVLASYAHPLVNRVELLSALMHNIKFPPETFATLVHEGLPDIESLEKKLSENPAENIAYLASVASDLKKRTRNLADKIYGLKWKKIVSEYSDKNFEIKDTDPADIVSLKQQIGPLEELMKKYQDLSKEVDKLIDKQFDNNEWTSLDQMLSGILHSSDTLLADNVKALIEFLQNNIHYILSSERTYMPDSMTIVEELTTTAYFIRAIYANDEPYAIDIAIATAINQILNYKVDGDEYDEFDSDGIENFAYVQQLGDIQLQDIHTFHRVVTSPHAIEGIYHLPDVSIESTLNEQYDKIFFLGLLQHMKRVDRSEFFADVKNALTIKPQFEHNSYSLLFIRDVLNTFTFDPNDPKEMEELITVSSVIPDPDLGSQLQEWAIDNVEHTYSTEELEQLLFSDSRTEGKALTAVRKRFIDQHVRTPEQLDNALERIVETSVITDRTTQERFGETILGNEVFKLMMGDPVSLLIYGMATKRSDDELRKYMLRRSVDSMAMSIEHSSKKASDIYHLDSVIDRLYQLDENTRYMFIRELLVGERGVLNDKKQLNRLIDHLFTDEILASSDESDQAVRDGLRRTIEAAAERADIPTLYFMFAPFIQERSFRRPQQPATNWDTLIDDSNALNDFHEDDIPEIKEALLSTLNSSSYDRKSGTWKDQCLDYRAQIGEKIVDIVGTNETETSTQVSPVEFIRLIAGKIGAPGVRLLQVIGQYINMPPELEAEFSQVYDSVPGQNKLSGYYTARREWGSITDELVEIGQELGGGSLATVWEMKTQNGEEALKVLNPNTRFYVDSLCDILEQTFASMEDAYPRQSKLGVLAVRDIREWLIADIEYEGFREKDEIFRAVNHGFKVDGSDYSIYVPQSYGEDSIYYKREEKIKGRNLTKVEELTAAGEDMKSIARLLAKNAVHQIISGVVHSDFHPGNIRVMDNHQVAILDRNFFIELDMSEKMLLGRLISESPDTILFTFASYLSTLEANTGLNNIPELLINTIERNGIDLNSPDGIAQAIASAKEVGIYVPLKVTLLVKNFMSLDKFCKTAGFASVKEAIAS